MLLQIWTTTLIAGAGALTCAWLVVLVRAKNDCSWRECLEIFHRQLQGSRILLGLFLIAMWVCASTKPARQIGGGSAITRCSNNVEMPTVKGNSHASANIGPTNAPRTLTEDVFASGEVLTQIGTNEVFDFSPPENATICADWRAFGAASDWIYLTFTNWSVRVAGQEANRLRIYSFGKIQPLIRQPNGRVATNRWYAPLQTSIGIVPEANWLLLRTDKRPSLFWHSLTPSNTLQLTWQHVLYNRAVEMPISFHAEISPSGRCVYRYDLSEAGTELVTNAVVGVSLGNVAIATNSIPTNVTSLAFYPLWSEDAVNPDRDGDASRIRLRCAVDFLTRRGGV